MNMHTIVRIQHPEDAQEIDKIMKILAASPDIKATAKTAPYNGKPYKFWELGNGANKSLSEREDGPRVWR